jgi:hypothetical protein
MRDGQFSSKAYGTHDYKDITIEGRVQFDLLTAIQRDYKLSSYSLNSVSAHFLGAQQGWQQVKASGRACSECVGSARHVTLSCAVPAPGLGGAQASRRRTCTTAPSPTCRCGYRRVVVGLLYGSRLGTWSRVAAGPLRRWRP